MARSWASVVSGLKPTVAAVSVLRADAPEWTPPPRCYYCGSAADVCEECVRQCTWMPTHTLQPVVSRGRCADHGGWSRPHEFYSAKMEEFIPQTCAGCREKHPWDTDDLLEVTGFKYERACLCHPLKSPNGANYNVVYVSICRYIRLGQSKSSPEQVAAWAEAAYQKEMEFSGDKERADVLKEAVLTNNYFHVSMPLKAW